MCICRTKRVLFDLDGTLFDTQRLHAEVEVDLIRVQSGGRVSIEPDELTRRYAGRPSQTVFAEILDCGPEEAQQFCDRKWAILMPRFAEAKPLADLPALFHALVSDGTSLAIGTASPREWAVHILEYHDLARYFSPDAIIGGDMVKEGKPHPEIWQKAMGGMQPRECLVVEDGSAGVEAAKTAGIPAVLLLPRRHLYARALNNLEEVLLLIA